MTPFFLSHLVFNVLGSSSSSTDHFSSPPHDLPMTVPYLDNYCLCSGYHYLLLDSCSGFLTSLCFNFCPLQSVLNTETRQVKCRVLKISSLASYLKVKTEVFTVAFKSSRSVSSFSPNLYLYLLASFPPLCPLLTSCRGTGLLFLEQAGSVSALRHLHLLIFLSRMLFRQVSAFLCFLL